ncbi:MAG: acid phosphatase [Candidatus Magasanikbacteria bacterium]|nr:acid phosphatase [Candidatus Magasanikbacteria bacterium]
MKTKNLGLAVFVSLVAIIGYLYPYQAQADAYKDQKIPQFGHEVVVLLENHSYEQVIDNSKMPYLNSLAKAYAYTAEYYANTHPSIGNYFFLTTGKIQSNDDGFKGKVTDDNIVRKLNGAGKSWTVYADALPKVGYMGGNIGTYIKRHNPFVYFTDVIDHPSQQNKIVPFTQFSKDLAAGTLPSFSFIVPDGCHTSHDCGRTEADKWLKANIDPLVKNSSFMKDGLLVIVFDEGQESDKRHGGGRIPVVFVGDKVRPEYKSREFYQHPDLLRTLLEGLVGIRTS